MQEKKTTLLFYICRKITCYTYRTDLNKYKIYIIVKIRRVRSLHSVSNISWKHKFIISLLMRDSINDALRFGSIFN